MTWKKITKNLRIVGVPAAILTEHLPDVNDQRVPQEHNAYTSSTLQDRGSHGDDSERSKSLWRWYISTDIMFLDIIHRPVFI
jgi:hypothetical protein